MHFCVSHVSHVLLRCVTDETLKGASWVEEREATRRRWGVDKGRWGERPKCEDERVRMP